MMFMMGINTKSFMGVPIANNTQFFMIVTIAATK